MEETMRNHRALRRVPARGSVLAAIAVVLVVGVAHAQLGPGDSAPDFTLPDVNGVNHSLSDYRGQVVLLDFIGYDCPPCIQSAPAVEQIWRDFRDTGAFQVIALDAWNGQVFQVQGYIERTAVTFPVLMFAGSLTSPAQYGISFDNYVVVDADGIIRYTSVDEPGASFNDTALRNTIQAYLPVAVSSESWGAIKGLYR